MPRSTTHTFADGYIKWLRSHVGNQLIYLVYTTSLVFNDEGHLLVQERYDFDWLSIPGGALELDESLAECATREVYEETGIECSVERLVGVFSHPQYNLLYPNGDQVQPWTVAFVCRANSDSIQVDGRETLNAQFHPVDDELRSRLPLQYRHILEAAERSQEPFIEEPYWAPQTQPFYPILRDKIGTERINLSGGSAVIFNEQGYVLAVHEKSVNEWGIPAGLADLGESSTATIIREVQEETGLQIEPVRVLGVYSDPAITYRTLPNGDQARWIDLILECKIASGEVQLDRSEVDGIRYMSLEDILAQPNLSPLRKQVIEDIIHREHAPFIR